MGGYVSPGMSPRRALTIADLILRRGDVAANRAMQSGQIWGNALANLGATVGGAIQQHQQQKEMDKRSEALTQLAQSDIWGQDPQAGMAAAVDILGPQEGVKFGRGIMATAQVAEKPDPAVAQKNLPAIAQGWMSATPTVRQQLWNPLRQTLINAQLGTEQDWPAQWSEEMAPQVQAIAEQYMPEEESAQPFTLSPGAARYDAEGNLIAERAAAEKQDTRSLEVRAADALLSGDLEAYDKLKRAKTEIAAAGRAPEPPASADPVTAGVWMLEQGGTLSDVKGDEQAITQQAVAAGIPVYRNAKHKESYETLNVMKQDAQELADLIGTGDEITPDQEMVRKYLGPLMGDITAAATGGGIKEAMLKLNPIARALGLGDVPEKVRRAVALMFNLSDRRVRERSGAQVNEKELDRIMRFTMAPNLSVSQIVSNLGNLQREISTTQQAYAPIGGAGGSKAPAAGQSFTVGQFKVTVEQ